MVKIIKKPTIVGNSKGFVIDKKYINLDLNKYYEITIKELKGGRTK